MKMDSTSHINVAKPLEVETNGNKFGSVIFSLHQGTYYPRVTLFMSLLHFNQLRAAVNAFDVTTVKRA